MRKDILFVVLVLTVWIAGCAPEPKLRVLWPPPPSEPKLEFVGTYTSQYSFRKEGMSKLVDTIAGEGAAARFKSPFGIVGDGEGRVFISDIHWKNIRVYNFNTRHVDFFFKHSPLGAPLGLAFDDNNRLYVADSELNRVFVFDSSKKETVYTLGETEPEFGRPAYLVLNERLGRLYVSDGKAHKIHVFDLQGQHLFSFGEPGDEPGELFAPQGMAVDDQDRLFVCDQLNARIQVFDADGKFLYQFGERGDQVYQFESPKDVAFDSDGNLYVVDGRRPHVFTYTPDGDLLLSTGGSNPTTHPLGFATPRSIFIDENDRIFITDLSNMRFSVWQYLSSAYLEKNPIDEKEKAHLQRKLKEAEQEK